jgi:hypothetical protein
LLANILSTLESPNLNKVLIAPCTGEFIISPRIVYSKQRQVIPFWLMKFGFLLVSHGLLVLNATTQGG